jgi:hypothetical protein
MPDAMQRLCRIGPVVMKKHARAGFVAREQRLRRPVQRMTADATTFVAPSGKDRSGQPADPVS